MRRARLQRRGGAACRAARTRGCTQPRAPAAPACSGNAEQLAGRPAAGARGSGWRDRAARRRARRTARSACGPDRPGAGWSIPACAPECGASISSTRSSKLRSSRAGGWNEIRRRSGQSSSCIVAASAPGCAGARAADRRSRRAPAVGSSATSHTSTRSSRMRCSQRASELCDQLADAAARGERVRARAAAARGRRRSPGASAARPGRVRENDADRLAHAASARSG